MASRHDGAANVVAEIDVARRRADEPAVKDGKGKSTGSRVKARTSGRTLLQVFFAHGPGRVLGPYKTFKGAERAAARVFGAHEYVKFVRKTVRKAT